MTIPPITIGPPVNWQPKLAGLLASAAGFVMLNQGDFSKHPWIVHLAMYIFAAGPTAIGFTTKQVNVTGGSVVNSGNNPATVAATAVPKN